MEVTIAIPEWLFWVIGIPVCLIVLLIFIIGLRIFLYILLHE